MILSLVQSLFADGTSLIVIIVALSVILALSRWTRAPQKSVFGPEFKTAKKPIENDRKAREAVLSQRFKASRVANVEYDTILIGSGPGSLTAAVFLSRLGHRVLVLEQHDVAGGTLHTFEDKGFEFTTGLHYIGAMGIGELPRYFCDQLTRYQVDFAVMDDTVDEVAIVGEHSTRSYRPKSGIERAVSSLVAQFPEERAAIEKYYQVLSYGGRAFIMYVGLLKFLPYPIVKFLLKTGLFRFVSDVPSKGYTTKSLLEFINELTNNEDLRTVFQCLSLDYGGQPATTPVLLHGVVIDHFVEGGYFPVGGPTEIPYHLCSEIRERGGDVLVCADVNRILFDANGTARGVEIGTSNTKIYAANIVSGVGLANTFHKLVPKHIAKQSPAYSVYEKVGASPGCMTLSVGLDGTAEELGLPNTNTWAFREGYNVQRCLDEHVQKKFADVSLDEFPGLLFISSSSARDPNTKITMPGKTSLELVTLTNSEWFQEWESERKGHRGQAYEDRKMELARSMWRMCLTVFPHLDGKVEYLEAGTTATNHYYLGTEHGEVYNMDHSMDRYEPMAQAKLRPDSGIQGLYLTGCDIVSAGVMPSLFSGLMTASAIVNRNLFAELESAHKTDQAPKL